MSRRRSVSVKRKLFVNADPKYTLRENGCLADIVPTLIQLMGMEQPVEMTGKSLLVEK